MSLIMEDDKLLKPTDMSLLSVVKMICANYFPDKVCAAYCHSLLIYIDLQYNMLYLL